MIMRRWGIPYISGLVADQPGIQWTAAVFSEHASRRYTAICVVSEGEHMCRYGRVIRSGLIVDTDEARMPA
jgi:hypothetical protein